MKKEKEQPKKLPGYVEDSTSEMYSPDKLMDTLHASSACQFGVNTGDRIKQTKRT